MKGIYFLALMMFFGLFISFYSMYRVTNILQERKLTAVPNSSAKVEQRDTTGLVFTDPEIQPYMIGSFVGFALFIVGAVGGLIAVVKVFTRRF